MARIGLISDTHGLLRPEAKALLLGSERIVHAGDVGDARILEELEAIAPLTAVRGNNDKGLWADTLPDTALLRITDVLIYVVHDIAQAEITPASKGVRVVVYGHSHKPSVAEREGVLYVNPGSAGPRRFKLPVTIAELLVEGRSVAANIIELEVPPKVGGER